MSHVGRRGLVGLGLLLIVTGCSSADSGGGPEQASTASAVAEPSSASPAPPPTDSAYRTALTRWRAATGDFASWSGAGSVVTSGGELSLDRATAVTESDPYPAGGYLGRNFYTGGTYVVGEAVSPVTMTAVGFSEAIASWNARTPPGTWIEALVRARVGGGRFTRFYNLGIWAEDSSTVERHSVRDERDADGEVAVDTLTLAGPLVADAFQLKFRLFERGAGGEPERGQRVGGRLHPARRGAIEVPGDPALWDRVLPVPECSQSVYPDGGAVWCSPTATSMVLAYWAGATGPCEPRVRAAVAGVYDWVYDGHGSWPFNTAYAATAGLEAYVDRFTSLSELEPWIAAGVPVVVSYSWNDGSLTGAPVPASDGHLAVVVGFDAAGNPIVNDPAARSDGDVQRTYDRSELEDLWLASSGGVVYLMYPPGHAVPPV